MFSQNQEEKHILEYFGDYVGTFADIGCNDCVTLSNTRALALKGWKGIFIDPIPEVINKCKELYKGQRGYYPYKVAIGDFNGDDVINGSGSLLSKNDTGLVSTFHKEEMDRFKRTVSYHPVPTKVQKWKTFLNMKRITKFDFISLDVERHELIILPQIDLTDVKCICIEWNGSEVLKKEYDYYMKDFRIIYTSLENLIYVR